MITLGYIFIAIIVFFSFFYFLIKYYEKQDTCYTFSDWYFDNWVEFNIGCAIFWIIFLPIIFVATCFWSICKIIMKIHKVK